MIASIIIGHGNFGSSILESAEMIIGKQQNIQLIDFLKKDSLEDIDRKISQALDNLDTEDGVIVLADLMGGTPFNRMMLQASENPDIKVVAGVNMPLVMEILNNRSKISDLDSFIEENISMSREMMVLGNKLL